MSLRINKELNALGSLQVLVRVKKVSNKVTSNKIGVAGLKLYNSALRLKNDYWNNS